MMPAQFAADLQSGLVELRAMAEARMTSTWTIGTDGGWVYNPATGKEEQAVTPLFTTKGRMKASRTFGNINQQAGGRTVTIVTRELHIPVGSQEVPVGALAKCTAVGASDDPTLLGAVVRIAGPAPGSQTTARRLEVTETLT